MQKLGVSTQLLAAADIYQALERGVIDATESPCPPWTSSSASVGSPVQLLPWLAAGGPAGAADEQEGVEGVPDTYKAMIETAGEAQISFTYSETEATQFGVMAEMREKHNVQVKRWGDEDPRRLEKGWREVLKEELAKDPLFKKVADHYLDFRKKYASGRTPGDEGELPRQVAGAGLGAA